MTPAQRASQVKPLSAEPEQQTTFTAFPKGTLLESGKVPIAEIAELALREGQCTNPIYRVHRWFARRLGSQFRVKLKLEFATTETEVHQADIAAGELPPAQELLAKITNKVFDSAKLPNRFA